jgi:hypothetical protein
MSTTSRRIVAVTVAAIIAVLTGIAVGLLAPTSAQCPDTPSPQAAASAAAGEGLGAPQAKPAQTTPAAAAPACEATMFAPLPAAMAVVGGLVAGLAVLVLLLLGGPPRTRAAPAAEDRRSAADRAALIQACIYVRDRTTSKALAERLGSALQQAGVSVLEPSGVRFDPARHEAGGAAPSDDPAKVGTIAAVEVPGYADRGHLLRAPVVTVYQAGDPRAREER